MSTNNTHIIIVVSVGGAVVIIRPRSSFWPLHKEGTEIGGLVDRAPAPNGELVHYFSFLSL